LNIFSGLYVPLKIYSHFRRLASGSVEIKAIFIGPQNKEFLVVFSRGPQKLLEALKVKTFSTIFPHGPPKILGPPEVGE
jgi:hypothetical protein